MKFSLQQLVDVECIKQLKYRYMRAIDTRDFPLLESCFTPGVRTGYSNDRHVMSGPKAIVQFVREHLGGTGSSHEAGHPEIAFVNEDHATGIWRLTDTVHHVAPRDIPIGVLSTRMTGKEVLTGAGHYHEEYVRLDGEWKIDKIGYERLFEHIGLREGSLTVGREHASTG